MRQQIRLKHLPLAVYREIAAHLELLDGVTIALNPQQSTEFEYTLSQIDSLEIYYPESVDPQVYEQAQRILAYYGDRYGVWEMGESGALEVR
ncbi:MAG TPA: hypothetical protein IGS53_18325 [Leptolyngbyaceae cyanobacterium M33_DOE_097]|uniref:Uncharacterized protein n=1 Tax=Oscillatoriales cyanobacterium SpSt-418 TaxID=2282169 RepID=A0A7C3KI11_9CYAN|nr:hypothetical protein [Leptolyngbyaceae cyanobacterium M33_DOE_097]